MCIVYMVAFTAIVNMVVNLRVLLKGFYWLDQDTKINPVGCLCLSKMKNKLPYIVNNVSCISCKKK